MEVGCQGGGSLHLAEIDPSQVDVRPEIFKEGDTIVRLMINGDLLCSIPLLVFPFQAFRISA